jgi:hypothetical protein
MGLLELAMVPPPWLPIKAAVEVGLQVWEVGAAVEGRGRERIEELLGFSVLLYRAGCWA